MAELDLNTENSDNVESELVGGRTREQYAKDLIEKLESFSDYEGNVIPYDLVRPIARLSVNMLIQETGKKYYHDVKSNIS